MSNFAVLCSAGWPLCRSFHCLHDSTCFKEYQELWSCVRLHTVVVSVTNP